VRIIDRSEIDFNGSEPPLEYDSDGEYEGSAPKHHYYRSEKILGKLYRAIDEKKIWKEDIRMNEVKSDGKSFWNELIALMSMLCSERDIVWTRRIKEAHQIRAT
jgi:hypothetical protein